MGKEALMIVPGSHPNREQYLDLPGNKVIMKGASNLGHIKALLEEK